MRNIALKAAKNKKNQASSDESEGETLSLLSKKFSKFLKKNRNKDSNKERYGNKKTSDFNANNILVMVVESKLWKSVFIRLAFLWWIGGSIHGRE